MKLLTLMVVIFTVLGIAEAEAKDRSEQTIQALDATLAGKAGVVFVTGESDTPQQVTIGTDTTDISVLTPQAREVLFQNVLVPPGRYDITVIGGAGSSTIDAVAGKLTFVRLPDNPISKTWPDSQVAKIAFVGLTTNVAVNASLTGEPNKDIYANVVEDDTIERAVDAWKMRQYLELKPESRRFRIEIQASLSMFPRPRLPQPAPAPIPRPPSEPAEPNPPSGSKN